MGEAGLLDIEDAGALTAYLRDAGRIGPGETPAVRVLTGGVSNRTVLVERPAGGAWVLKQALPKLRVAADWFSDPARVRREAEGLRWLARVAPPDTITPLVFEDPGQYLLAMEAVPQPHENWKSMLMGDPAAGLTYVHPFGSLLGSIHRAGHERRAEAASLFADRSFFESLRVEPYYRYSAAGVPEAAEFLEDLIAATDARRLTVVHGDYSPKNVLVRNRGLVLLDHEVIHFGDPAFDVGFALAHLLSKGHRLPEYRAHFRDAAMVFWRWYLAALGPVSWGGAELEASAARHTLGCRLARAAGRSPLEYLDAAQRARQRDAAVEVMRVPTRELTVTVVVNSFLEGV